MSDYKRFTKENKNKKITGYDLVCENCECKTKENCSKIDCLLMTKKRLSELNDIVLGLAILKANRFEVVKSNSGQIAVNSKDNNMPLIITNDVGYLTPTSDKWYLIDNEMERIKNEIKGKEELLEQAEQKLKELKEL